MSKERREYIRTLEHALKVVPDFDHLAYVTFMGDGKRKEIVKVADNLGWAVHLDITDMSLDNVLYSIMAALQGIEPRNQIKDDAIIRPLVPFIKLEEARREL